MEAAAYAVAVEVHDEAGFEGMVRVGPGCFGEEGALGIAGGC